MQPMLGSLPVTLEAVRVVRYGTGMMPVWTEASGPPMARSA
ncbi:hypothetical protein [Falsiroseomonas bella]|nr:hypothetical protein [Falsiroseomonas bella]